MWDLLFLVFDRDPLENQLSARHQREPLVVDVGWIAEDSRIQIGWLDRPINLSLLCSLAVVRLSLVRGGHIRCLSRGSDVGGSRHLIGSILSFTRVRGSTACRYDKQDRLDDQCPDADTLHAHPLTSHISSTMTQSRADRT